jgi:hypothetical protein
VQIRNVSGFQSEGLAFGTLRAAAPETRLSGGWRKKKKAASVSEDIKLAIQRQGYYMRKLTDPQVGMAATGWPRRLATLTPQAFNADQRLVRVRSASAA